MNGFGRFCTSKDVSIIYRANLRIMYQSKNFLVRFFNIFPEKSSKYPNLGCGGLQSRGVFSLRKLLNKAKMLVEGGTQNSQKYAERRTMGCPSERNCQKLSRNYFKNTFFRVFRPFRILS